MVFRHMRSMNSFAEIQERTGNKVIFLLDADPLTVKKITAGAEDHAPVGRLFNMDVLCPDRRKAERQELFSAENALVNNKTVQSCFSLG